MDDPPGTPASGADDQSSRPEDASARSAPPASAPDDRSALRRVSGQLGREGARRVGRLFTSGGVSFRDLAVSHAASAGGDTLVAIALAGTLFFSVPSGEARGNVALYLLLTVAPFAVIGPLLGSLLTRFPTAYRHGIVTSAGVRAVVAMFMVGQQDTLWLFPLAFTLLVLSRAHGISRSALLPVTVEAPTALVAANARLAQIGVLAGAVVAPFGALGLHFVGSSVPLVLAAITFVVAAVTGRRVPPPPQRALSPAGAPRLRLRGLDLPRPVRLAQLATGGVRLLNGFLLLLLAFAFRSENAGALDFGALLAAAGLGFGLASLSSPWLERRLREEPMVLAALAIEAAAAFIAGQWFGLLAASVLAAAAGFAWGTAKLAYDGLLQRSVPPDDRGVAFTRSETLYQLAWVLGAVLPTGIPIPTGIGLVVAGLAALSAQVLYVAALILPLQAAEASAVDPTGAIVETGADSDEFEEEDVRSAAGRQHPGSGRMSKPDEPPVGPWAGS